MRRLAGRLGSRPRTEPALGAAGRLRDCLLAGVIYRGGDGCGEASDG